MKKLLLLLFLIPVLASAQKTTGGNYTYIAQRYEWFTGMFQALGLPAGPGPAAFKAGQDIRAGALYYDSTGADAGLYQWTGLAWVKSSYTDADARAAISLTTTGTSGAATYSSATGVFNIPVYGGGGISEIIAGYGLQNVNDSTLDVDSLVMANRDWVMDRIADITVQFDSLGAAGISPMTTWNNILYSRRISVTGGLTIDTTASGGLVIDGSGVSASANQIEYVATDPDMTGTIAYNTTLRRVTVKDTTNNYYYHLAITDSVATGDENYDPDAEAYMNAVETGGRTLTDLEKGYINDFYLTAKARSYWDKIADGVFPIWENSTSATVTWKGFTTVAAVGSPTFASNGTDWNGTSQYFTTDFVPTSNTSGFIGYYSQDDITETSVCIGSSTGSNHYAIFLLITTTGQLGRIYTSTNQTASARGGTTTGMAITSRTASNDHRSYWNGSQTGSTVTAAGGTRPTHAIYIGARNADGSASTFSTQKCSAAVWGGTGLTVSEAADLTADIEVFMDAMGIGQIP